MLERVSLAPIPPRTRYEVVVIGVGICLLCPPHLVGSANGLR